MTDAWIRLGTHVLPYFNFLIAGLLAGFVTLLRNKPPTETKRRLDAVLCGIGAMGICWIAWRVFPEKFNYEDSIPYGIAIGFLGAGRIYGRAETSWRPNCWL